MKRIIALFLALTALCALLCSCGNMNVVGIGNYSFKHVHFTDMNEGHCAEVIQWYDNDNGVEVQTTEYGSLFLSEGSYIMFETGSKCPYCN